MKCPSTTWRLWFALAVLSLINLLFVGCAALDGSGGGVAGGAAAAAQDTPSGDIGGGRFQRGELIKVEFSDSNIPTHEENIKEDGTITLYLVGSIKAEGKTPGELQRDIQKAYVPRFYKNLNVTVKGTERFYFVGGEVKSSGRQLYLGPITLTGAIKSAGDFTDFAARKKVELKRGSSGKVYIINADKALKDASQDPPVYPGDNITVPRSPW